MTECAIVLVKSQFYHYTTQGLLYHVHIHHIRSALILSTYTQYDDVTNDGVVY